MSLLKELHEQPEWVRLGLFVLACATVISLVVSGWFISFERDTILATADKETANERLAARERERGSGPLAVVGRWSFVAAASIGRLIGFDREEGFDIESGDRQDSGRTYLLPLSP